VAERLTRCREASADREAGVVFLIEITAVIYKNLTTFSNGIGYKN